MPRRLSFGPHSALAFDSENGLLVTSVLRAPPGVARFTDRDEPERIYTQSWLRTPVARDAPRLARMVTDTTWEVIDLDEQVRCALGPPAGVPCDRLTVCALSADGERAFGIASSDAAEHETMVVWSAATGEVVCARPTLGSWPTASFAQGAPIVARLAGQVLEIWDCEADEVLNLALGTGALDLAVLGTTAFVGRGRTVDRYDLVTGRPLSPWPLPVRTITALSVRLGPLVVGAGTLVVVVEEGAVLSRHKAGGRFVAVAPDGRLAGSDGTNVVVLDP